MAKKKTNGKIFDLLNTLSSGESFFVEAPPKTVTAYAYSYGVSVSTCSVLVIEDVTKAEPVVKKITKVTLV